MSTAELAGMPIHTTAPPAPAPRMRRNRRRATISGLLFLAPFLLVYGIFLLYPVVQALYMSGFNWDLLSPLHKFIGTANYSRMLWGTGMSWTLDNEWAVRLVILGGGGAWAYHSWKRKGSPKAAVAIAAFALVFFVLLGFAPSQDGSWNDADFWVSLRNTLMFTLFTTPILIALGLGLALLLHNQRKARGVYRAVFFLPFVLPISAVTLIWSYLLNPDRGLIAGFLGWFGIHGIPFLSDPHLAMPSIIATTVWWSVGFNLVLFLAGLQDIEPNLYEAAGLDGASPWQRFRHITWPGLRHVTVLVTITQLIASFQIFGQVFIMTKGGPGTSTEVAIQHIYETGFKNYQLGYAATLSVFLFVVMAAVSAIQFRLTTKDA